MTSLGLSACLFLLQAAPAAPLGLPAFSRLFPAAPLPLSINDEEPCNKAAALSPTDAEEKVIKPVAALPEPRGNGLDYLAQFWSSALGRADTQERLRLPDTETGWPRPLRFRAVRRTTFKELTVLVVCVTQMPQPIQSSSVVYYALTFDGAGALRGGAALADLGGTEYARNEETARFSPDGVVETDSRYHYNYLYQLDGADEEAEDLVMRHRRTMTLSPSGVFTPGKSEVLNFVGTFVCAPERLLVLESKDGKPVPRILYQAKEGKKPLRLRVVAGDPASRKMTVQFPRGPQQYFLTVSADQKQIECRNPDGSVQVFKR
jgi:hypothetical protein